MSENIASSLFIVSHFQQFKRVVFFIEKYKTQHPKIILLYTKSNLHQIELVKNYVQINERNYAIDYLELPKSPNVLTLNKLNRFVKKYGDLLTREKPSNLFLLSYESHYALLANLAKQQGIKISLIEEGTASYKMLLDDFKPKKLSLKSELKLIYKQMSSENKTFAVLLKMLYIILMILKDIFYLPKALLIFTKKIYLTKSIQDRLMGKSKYSKYINDYFNEFDEIYASFPELLNNIFKSKKSEVFYPYENIASPLRDDGDITISKNDIIFSSQKYPIRDELYASVIIDILVRLIEGTDRKVFIKLHPRDLDAIEYSYIQLIEQKQLGSRVIIIKDRNVMLEELINYYSPYAVVSISSTSLIYSAINDTSIKSISISQFLIPVLKANNVKMKTLKLIESHAKILNVFPHIKQYDGFSNIDYA